MTQAHKQQYKLSGDSFKNKSNDDLQVIIPVIVFAVIYLISRI